MPKELKYKSSILEFWLARKDISRTQPIQFLVIAITNIPGKIRTRYLRNHRISAVHADVQVDAIGTTPLGLHAIVHVELTYKGNMTRSSGQTRKKINNRLQDLAQQHCAETVYREIISDLERRGNSDFGFCRRG